jgi:iron complex transport system substrate-binding protein
MDSTGLAARRWKQTDQKLTSLSSRQGFFISDQITKRRKVNVHAINRINIFGAFATLGLLLSACASAPLAPAPTDQSPIQVIDGLGRSITLPSSAQKVISLAPGSTEILFAIGAGAQVVGRDTFSDYPEQAKAIADIGGGFGELNTELILAQKPDLVLASSLTPPEQVKTLEDLKLKVFVLTNPKDFDGLYANLQTVARLTGHEQEADALIASLKQRVAALQAKIANVKDRPLVFYELDGTDPNAPWTPGPGTFVANLIQAAGAENLGNSLTGEWVQISIEELIAKDPQMVLIGDYTWGGVTAEDVRARAGWGALSAVKNGRLYPFDDNLVSRPGPRLVDGLEALARLFHPELFQ